MKQAVAKTNTAGGRARQICAKSKCRSWETQKKLHEALIQSVLLYSANIWALRYLKAIESSHLTFFKYLFHLNRTTPHYIIRLETNTQNISVKVLNQALNWMSHIMEMPNNRYPKQCLDTLLELAPTATIKNNWVLQVRQILASFNQDDTVSSQQNYFVRKSEINKITARYSQHLKNLDLQSTSVSSYCPTYKHLYNNNTTYQTYLTMNLPYPQTRLLAQLRTANNKSIKLSYRNRTIVLNPEAE